MPRTGARRAQVTPSTSREEMMRVLGQRLTELREAQGLQQREAAALANIAPEQWNTYERRRHLPDAYNLDRIARAFNVSIEELTRVGTEGEQRWRERRRWHTLRAAINRVRALGDNDFANFVATVTALADVLERQRTQGE
jgi:transcriptional regulator with XRE-family HTH domain